MLQKVEEVNRIRAACADSEAAVIVEAAEAIREWIDRGANSSSLGTAVR